MERPSDLGKNALEHRKTAIIPRAELWLGSDIFKKCGLEDSIEGHVKLRKMLGMDILFIPVSRQDRTAQSQGYRYFNPGELKKALEISEVPAGAIIDGPFQRLAEKMGLMNLFGAWIKDRDSIKDYFLLETRQSVSLISDALELRPHIVVIADDIAYENGAYMSDEDLDRFLRPFYCRAVDLIHAAGAYAMYHSCGNLTNIMPRIVSCGFDGLAACQGGSMDINVLKKEYGERLTFLTGIDANLLQTGLLMDRTGKEDFIRLIRDLAVGGGFILGSSCGLYSGAFLENISALYEISEGIKIRNPEFEIQNNIKS